jgi:hypothetical protein
MTTKQHTYGLYDYKTKQLKSFENRFGVLLRVARKRVRRRSLIPNVSAGNKTLCRWQHVARELRVERTCSTE